MSVRASAKAARFTESVIREMTRLANLHGAVNLSQGFPDFPAPGGGEGGGAAGDRRRRQPVRDHLGRALAARGHRGQVHAPVRRAVDPEREVTVTCGSTEAMIATLLAVLDPGDEVVVFEPFYENYGPDAILSGATPRFVKLRPPDWSFDRDELRRAFSTKTRAIIVNTPNNPTGKVFTRDELEFIAGLCREHDALAITDEIYEHILYDGADARPDGDAARDGRAHGHHQRDEQDLQRHRLAGGLGDRAARRSPPRSARCTTSSPWARRRRCRRRARWPSPCPTRTTARSPPATPAGATGWCRSSSARASAPTSRAARTT